MIAASGYDSSLTFRSVLIPPGSPGVGQMALNAPNSQGDFADPVRCRRADQSGSGPASSKRRPIRGQTALGSITIAQEVNRPEPRGTGDDGATELR